MEASTVVEDPRLTTFFSRQTEVWMGISFIVLSLVGVVGNTYTILVMVFRKRLYNCCTPYLISVSMSDLIMTAIILPVAGLNAVTGLSYIPIQMCKGISIIFHILLSKNFRERSELLLLIFVIPGTSYLGLAMVSVIRCVGIWTNNTCFILRYTKTLICMTWVIPILSISHTLYGNWGSDEHIRTGFVCWYFCGIKHMLHVSQYVPDEKASYFLFPFILLGPPLCS